MESSASEKDQELTDARAAFQAGKYLFLLQKYNG